MPYSTPTSWRAATARRAPDPPDQEPLVAQRGDLVAVRGDECRLRRAQHQGTLGIDCRSHWRRRSQQSREAARKLVAGGALHWRAIRGHHFGQLPPVIGSDRCGNRLVAHPQRIAILRPCPANTGQQHEQGPQVRADSAQQRR